MSVKSVFTPVPVLVAVALAGCASMTASNPPAANAQSCTQLQDGIKTISKEIKEMQLQEIGDNSAPRATMRAARMSFGATAQSNLMAYGRMMGCKFSGLQLPLSTQHISDSPEAADL